MKHIKLFEGFISNRLIFDELINKKFPIEVGSGTQTTIWDKNKLLSKLGEVITHNLFDNEFYHNWTNKGKEYSDIFKADVKEPMLSSIDKTLNKYFSFKKTSYSKNEDVLVFTYDIDNQLWIDNWFKINKSISKELKDDYYKYRQKYAGVSLK